MITHYENARHGRAPSVHVAGWIQPRGWRIPRPLCIGRRHRIRPCSPCRPCSRPCAPNALPARSRRSGLGRRLAHLAPAGLPACGLRPLRHVRATLCAARAMLHHEFVAGQAAIAVGIRASEELCATRSHPRLHVAAVQVAVAVGIHLVEAARHLPLRSLGLDAADAAILVGVQRLQPGAALAALAAPRIPRPAAGARPAGQPAVLVLVELVKRPASLGNQRPRCGR